jgi:hypothetical protein
MQARQDEVTAVRTFGLHDRPAGYRCRHIRMIVYGIPVGGWL